MTGKADFTAEEWHLIVQGPPTAGMIVTHLGCPTAAGLPSATIGSENIRRTSPASASCATSPCGAWL